MTAAIAKVEQKSVELGALFRRHFRRFLRRVSVVFLAGGVCDFRFNFGRSGERRGAERGAAYARTSNLRHNVINEWF